MLNETFTFILGVSVVAILMAIRHIALKSAPTSQSVERRRQRAIEALALFEAESAALQAYDATVEQWRAEFQRPRAACAAYGD